MLLLLFAMRPLHAVDFPLNWRWANPGPHGNTVYDMVSKFGLVIQACEQGQLYSSSDLNLWEPLVTGTTNSLRGLAFQGGRLIVTGANGTVLYADSLSDIKTAMVNPPTSDWLEGVAAAAGVLVAVGDNGAVYTSSLGVSWTRQSTGNTRWLSGVAVSPAGLFVAVGEGGHIATSTNATSWTTRTSGTTAWLNRVKWLNDRFWAMGDAGVLRASVDGITWVAVSSGATKGLFSGSNNGAQYLMVGDAEVRTAAGFPLAWTDELNSQRPSPPPVWTYYAAERFDPYHLIAGRSGMFVRGFAFGSPPIHYWEAYDDSIRNWLWDMTRLPELLVAVGDFATILTSGGGVDWELELVPNSVTNSIFLGAGGDTNALITVGNQGTILYSPSQLTNIVTTNSFGQVETNTVDAIGTLWYAVNPRPTTNDLQGVAVRNGRYVVTGAGGTLLTSDNRGTNWTQRIVPVTSFLSGVAAGPDGFVAVGDNGVVITSADGASWTLRNSGTTDWLFRVRHLGGQFNTVGENGTILQSADGIIWSARSSGTTRWLNDVTRLNDTNQTWFVVGNQGTVLGSTNAIDWSPAGTLTSKSLYAAGHNGAGLLVAAGVEGAILRAQISPLTNSIEIVEYTRSTNQSSFLFAGQTGQRFTLDRSPAFTNWVSGDPLEFLDGSGTLLYIEQNPPSPPVVEFYRTTLEP